MNENKGYIDHIIENFRLFGFPNLEFHQDYGFCVGTLCEVFPRVTTIVALFVGYLDEADLERLAQSTNPYEALIMAFHSFATVWFGDR